MRNPVACVACRSAKQKCIHNDSPPCERCKTTLRAESCQFPPPGTSSFHRQPKRPRRDSPQASNSTPQSLQSPNRRGDTSISANALVQPLLSPSAVQVSDLDPYDLLTDEVKNSYLRCSYKWSFHHTPTLLLRIRDRTLESWVAWAILALAIRFVKEAPAPFKTQTEASNAYAAHARQLLQPDLETPSVSRVQALLMLTGHDWGAGNGRRAWIYLGMAIRMVQIMDLCQELPHTKNRLPTREEFIEMEERRRTAWTAFLMDSLLSGGKGRKRSLDASDMLIQLPCEKDAFVFGEAVCCEQLDGHVQMPSPSLDIGELGIIAYSLRAANTWGMVARWACSSTVNSELPWTQTSEFSRLVYNLDAWKKSLPQRLQYDLFSLHAHNAIDQGQAFCYMHSIHFMSFMFLHRAYLPVLGPNTGQSDETPRSYDDHADTWKRWQQLSRSELFKEATLVCEMMEEMRTFGVYFLRGLVPWIGFTIYTAVGVMLYSYNFPSEDDDPAIAEKARERVIQGCIFLKEMKTQWPMAQHWFETIKRMQAYYRTMHGEDGPVSLDERRALRSAMIDYGALQPSPVHSPQDQRVPDKQSTQDVSLSLTITVPHVPLLIPPQNQPHSASPLKPSTFESTGSFFNLGHTFDDTGNSFDFDFNFSSADVESIMVNATQDFWASFPGEVGYT
ncbi:hypothetical protein K432DRAFT_307718 [Lepidopterella palustris CBS 459.81]|uniref:Zn(2)-C6 fungal-type domain-containing protein n=1 Tax=Lepidopterella palustris CBS 459.81 TaxID=1314670 RepID=A0A8E2JBF0_9PEZI|nr:hypothetical protein K432DRAFT_307718 [Lepidopterella palustris CBS 459.81]